VILGARTVQSKLDVDARVLDASGVSTPSGRLRSLRLQTTEGSTSVPGSVLRSALGLRSTWLTVGVLRLDQPRGAVVFGSTLALSGVARALPSPLLSSSQDGGGAWSRVGPVQRDGSGLVTLVVTPARTMRYRLEADGAASPAVLVEVAPRLQLRQPAEPGALTGIVRPRLKGALVTIERRRGAAWEPVAEATVDASGAFRAELSVVPGSYRARLPRNGGWAEGIAPVLAVTG
jgi:hypothetical protein